VSGRRKDEREMIHLNKSSHDEENANEELFTEMFAFNRRNQLSDELLRIFKREKD